MPRRPHPRPRRQPAGPCRARAAPRRRTGPVNARERQGRHTPVARRVGLTVLRPYGLAATDAPGNTLTYSATGLPDGLSIDPSAASSPARSRTTPPATRPTT